MKRGEGMEGRSKWKTNNGIETLYWANTVEFLV